MTSARPDRPATRRARGLAAEAAVEQHLVGRGWTVRARNVVVAGGELDLVMCDGGTIVFVEVRMRRSGATAALCSIAPAKVRRIVRAAALWLAGQPWSDSPVRFDVVAATPIGGGYSLTHLPNAFDATDGGLP